MSANLPYRNHPFTEQTAKELNLPVGSRFSITPYEDQRHRTHRTPSSSSKASKCSTSSKSSMSSRSSTSSMSLDEDVEKRRNVYSTSTVETVTDAHCFADSGWGHDNCVFRLARAFWSLREDGVIDTSDFEDLVKAWHESTEAEHTYEDGSKVKIKSLSWVSSWDKFSKRIGKVKTKMGDGPMVEIVERARLADNPPAAAKYESDPIHCWLIRLCVELQREHGDDPFPLSCRGPAGPMGVSHKIINEKLNSLRASGIIELVSLGGRSKGGAKSSHYRCLIPLEPQDELPF